MIRINLMRGVKIAPQREGFSPCDSVPPWIPWSFVLLAAWMIADHFAR